MPSVGEVNRGRDGATYVQTEEGPVRLPQSARTTWQRVRWLLLRGYVWAAYLMAKHSDKVVLAALKRAAPNVPWNNLAYAARRR